MQGWKQGRASQRLLALALFGLVFFNFPMLSIPAAIASDVGAAWAYLFAVWAILIFLAWRSSGEREP